MLKRDIMDFWSQSDVSVEEVAEKWLEEQGGATSNIASDFIRTFIAGANWQLNKINNLIQKHIDTVSNDLVIISLMDLQNEIKTLTNNGKDR